MDSFQTGFSQHSVIYWLLTVGFFLALFMWLILERRRSRRFEERISALLGESEEGGTARMLAEYLTTVRNTDAAVRHIQDQHERVVSIMPTVIRHVGLVRFSPFHDTGGDQSFALALLDGRQDGVILTGLHSRNDSRLYAKPIEGGTSQYSLTPEELQAISRAVTAEPAVTRT